MRKRVLITLEQEPYDRLMANCKKVGLKNYWFGRQINTLVASLDAIVLTILEAQEKGIAMTEEEGKKMIIDTAEQAFGFNLSELMEK